MSKSKVFIALLIAALAVTTVNAASQQEKDLIVVLKSSDATLKEKADACRILARVGTKDSVPALAALLGDAKLSHMARYGLETIDDSSVDDALLAALTRLEGRPLVGVIGSIGVRGDERAVKPLAVKLADSDPLVACAAARALGSIGSTAAVSALYRAKNTASDQAKPAIYEGLFRCAENYLAGGEKSRALTIYNDLREVKEPHQVRTGALRGAILAGEDGLLEKSLESNDYYVFSAAVQTAMEMSSSKVTSTLTASLKGQSADNKILILGALANRGDAAAMPAISKLAESGDKRVRIAAIEAMPPIGDAAAVPVLAELLGDSDGDIAAAAQQNLASMSGRKVNAAVMLMLNSSNSDMQLKGVDLISLRRMEDAVPALLKTAKDNDASVRAASIRAVGELAGAKQFPAVVDLLLDAENSAEIRAAENALAAICTRQARPVPGMAKIIEATYGAKQGPSADVTAKLAKIVRGGKLTVAASNANFGDPAQGTVKQLTVKYSVNGNTHTKTVPENGEITFAAGATPQPLVDELVSAIPDASAQQKLALLRALRSTNNPKALQAVRSAIKSNNAEVREQAVSLLCGWPTPDALSDVMALAKNTDNRKTKILAVRGAIRLIPIQNASTADKIADLRQVLPLIERNEEKRLFLGALPAVASAQALQMAVDHLDGAAKTEAGFAAVAVGEKIVAGNKALVADAMQKVLDAVDNKDVQQRAKAVLDQAK